LPSGPLGRQWLRGQGWALASIALATRPKGAPLTLEGPTRTMRGVPAGELTFHPATGAPGARRPAQPVRGAHDPRCVTAGCVLRWGAGHRRRGQRPATVRYRARGSGPGCPATCGESPHNPLAAAVQLRPARSRSPSTSRAHPPRDRLGPVGLARRRCALEDRGESCNKPGWRMAVALADVRSVLRLGPCRSAPAGGRGEGLVATLP
jgi:hypothetical protein